MKNYLLMLVVVFLSFAFASNSPAGELEEKLLLEIGKGQIDVIQDLLNKGVDVNAKNAKGITALSIASDAGNLDSVRALLDKGANVNLKNSNGITALMRAAEAGRLDVVRALLEKGADVNAKDDVGFSVLMRTAIHDYRDVVQLLIKRGANVNAKFEGATALMLATENNQKEVVRVLLDSKANINNIDDEGGSALTIAICRGHKDIEKMLKKAGATKPKLKKVHLVGNLYTLQRLIADGTKAKVIGADTMFESESKKYFIVNTSTNSNHVTCEKDEYEVDGEIYRNFIIAPKIKCISAKSRKVSAEELQCNDLARKGELKEGITVDECIKKLKSYRR